MSEARTSHKQTRIGTVVSNRMDKTVVVQTTTLKEHPIYRKYMRRRKNFKAHDEKNECGMGDRVLIMETRPLSKEKCWRVVEILEKGFVATGEVIDPTEMFTTKKQKREERRAEKKLLDAAHKDEEDLVEDETGAQAAPEPAAHAEAAAEVPAEPTSEQQQDGESDDTEGNKA